MPVTSTRWGADEPDHSTNSSCVPRLKKSLGKSFEILFRVRERELCSKILFGRLGGAERFDLSVGEWVAARRL